MNLLDFLQSASNAAASNVSGPVDLVSTLLNKLGVPVQNAVGGSDWMKKQGLIRDVQQSPSSLAGETFGLLGPMAAAAKAPQIASGLLKAGENAAIPRQMNPQMGAVVYHGSPHKFDKFDSSKIGTGEGAQAYGHGLYLADAPEVAQTYKATAPFVGRHVQQIGLDALKKSGGDAKKARALLHEQYATNKDPYLRQPLADAYNNIDDIAKGDVGGNLYKVDLPDEAIAKMLDWDKPLSQQAPEVQSAIESAMPGLKQRTWVKGNQQITDPETVARIEQMMIKRPAEVEAQGFRKATLWDEMTGKDIHYALGGQAMNSAGRGEQSLRNAGIPGIRYLDGGSRGAGSGTSNYVVFPGAEDLLKILERNGIAP